ncbi:hypothetical protein CXG81DRAFT_14817 [Caulochytrium protostelioides]|uniref:60S ribosomal protein L27 n=1 Tax=Caulochytrium protostelioides TaxID=1555241 RepID=A0A4P9X1Z4_9FUNG|nr:putative ribosomal protein L27 variant 1 [Caulochytrium protostelioides]RKO99215.1 hypothetical protein CXG81DRAFT_14817 [Caulochytrium protostelioides]|eukprot:RKO99215.1 hypothetical protein CXG81DRAFT_14817 [Caulochytrium protostelioides]
MPKFLRSGKVVLLLQGRHAGKKAVIVKTADEGNAARPYPHCIVVGMKRYPKTVVRAHTTKQQKDRAARLAVFVKAVNYNHIMPTRYGIDVDFKSTVTPEVVEDPSKRKQAKKAAAKMLKQHYLAGKNKWFFQKLRF